MILCHISRRSVVNNSYKQTGIRSTEQRSKELDSSSTENNAPEWQQMLSDDNNDGQQLLTAERPSHQHGTSFPTSKVLAAITRPAAPHLTQTVHAERITEAAVDLHGLLRSIRCGFECSDSRFTLRTLWGLSTEWFCTSRKEQSQTLLTTAPAVNINIV